MRWIRFGMGLALAVLLIGLIMLAPFRSIAEGGMTLQSEQESVRIGEQIAFVGTGFVANEQVTSWATNPVKGVVNGQHAAADSNGRVRVLFDVPDNGIGGQWSFTVRGERSHLTEVTTFFVHGHSPTSSEFQAKVYPPGGAPGTTFSFAATIFDDDEEVSYWVTDPNGEVYAGFHQGARSNGDGRVDIEWTAPTDVLSGRWVMTMQGYDSDEARAVPFWIGYDDGAQVAPTTPPTTQPVVVCTPTPSPVPTESPATPTAEPVATSTPTATAEPACPACPPCPACPSVPTGAALPTNTPLPARSGGESPDPTATPTTMPTLDDWPLPLSGAPDNPYRSNPQSFKR